MKEPRRWLEPNNHSAEARLLRAAANEPLPNAALHRAGHRLGISSALLSATSGSLAATTTAQSVTVSSAAAAAAAGSGAVLVVTLGKAIAVGVGIGAVFVGTAHWTIHRHSAVTAPSSEMVVVHATRTPAVTVEPNSANAEPPAPSDESRDLLRVPLTLANASELDNSKSKSQARLAVEPLPVSSHPRSVAQVTSPTALARFTDEPEQPSGIPVKPTPSNLTEPPPPTARKGSTLAHEVRALDSVRNALRSGDAKRALDELDKSDRERVFQLLGREAAVLRVEALGALGRAQQAATLARRLLAEDVSPVQRKSLERWVEAVHP